MELQNTSQKNYTVEVVPPLYKVSGILVNPLVKQLEAGRSTLVSVRFDSKFRDIDYRVMNSIMEPEIQESKNTGLVSVRNKRLEERIKKEKLEKEQAQQVDPKAKNDPKGKAPAAVQRAPTKKEDEKPATNPKGVKKTQQQIDEEEAEERRIKEEALLAEQRRLQELEA